MTPAQKAALRDAVADYDAADAAFMAALDAPIAPGADGVAAYVNRGDRASDLRSAAAMYVVSLVKNMLANEPNAAALVAALPDTGEP